MKIEILQNSEMETKLQMEKLGKRIGKKDSSIRNKIQDKEDRISGKDTKDDMDKKIKENTKYKNFLT